VLRIFRLARAAGVCVSLAFVTCLLTPGVAFAPPDGPTITSLTFSTTTLDVTAGPQTLEVTISAEPGISPFPEGGTYAYIEFVRPDGRMGNAAELIYPNTTFEVTFPQYIQSGTWSIYDISLRRGDSGYDRMPGSWLASCGFQTTVDILSNPDRTPPELTALSFQNEPLDLRGSTQTLPVAVGYVDDLAGVNTVEITFRGPDGGHAWGHLRHPAGPASAIVDTVFEPWEDAGIWHLEDLTIYDRVGNYRTYHEADLLAAGFPTTIETVSTHDTTAPILTGLTMSPGVVYSGDGPAVLYVGLQITEDISGLLVESDDFDDYAELTFLGPHGAYLTGYARVPSPWAKVEIPVGTEAGVWTLDFLELRDQRVNYRRYRTPDLVALGLPTTFEIRTGTAPPAFTDVGPWTRYAPAITALAGLGVVGGYQVGDTWEYRPDNPIWRAQFAKMIDGAMKIEVSEDLTSSFTDLGPDDYSNLYPHEYVAAAAAAGITVGTAPGLFSPYVDISRAQVVTMIVRAAQSLSPEQLLPLPSGYTGSLGLFEPTHGPAMALAECNGILEGLDGFGSAWDPWRPATRGEVAQMLWNLLGRPAD
jgi:hypothetical protein